MKARNRWWRNRIRTALLHLEIRDTATSTPHETIRFIYAIFEPRAICSTLSLWKSTLIQSGHLSKRTATASPSAKIPPSLDHHLGRRSISERTPYSPIDPLTLSPWRSITQTCHTMTTVVGIHRCATSKSRSILLLQAKKTIALEPTINACLQQAVA